MIHTRARIHTLSSRHLAVDNARIYPFFPFLFVSIVVYTFADHGTVIIIVSATIKWTENY